MKLFTFFIGAFLFLFSLVVHGQNPLFSTDTLVNFKHKGNNFLPNGSFELGLGAEPFYPGWYTEEAFGYPPDKPEIITNDGADGSNSLSIKNIHPHTRLRLEFVCPNLIGNTNKTFFLSYKVKSNKSNVRVRAVWGDTGHLITNNEVNKWIRVKYQYTFATAYQKMNLFAESESNEIFDIQFDSITLSLADNSSGDWFPSDDVEAVFIPTGKSNDMHFQKDPVVLKYALNALSSKNVNLELHLVDLSRDGVTTFPFFKNNVSVSTASLLGDINLGTLKTGAYMALLAVSDSNTGNLLTVARERFTVMYDLTNVPPPVDFVVGMHGGLRSFGDPGTLEYCWRGFWDTDEYYQNAYQIGIRMQRIFSHMRFPQVYQDAFFWQRSDHQIDAALRNGCKTMFSILMGRRFNPFANPPNADDPNGWFLAHAVYHPFAVNNTVPEELTFASTRDQIKKFFKEVAIRYKGKIDCLELHNEVNLLMFPQQAVKYIFEPAYKIFKKIAPDIPVVMNQTMDGVYSHDGDHFTQHFFWSGGGDFSDGFTYHPYARHDIAFKGISYSILNEKFRKDFTKPGRKFYMGMSEIHGIGAYGCPGWDAIQRTLLDWSATSDCSAGIISDGLYFLETGSLMAWPGRGSKAPGIGAAALNAFYKMLGGFEYIKRIDKDENILVALFKNKTTGEYAVAMAAANDPTQCPRIDMDISSINCKKYDQFGGLIENPQNSFLLTREAVYFKSTDQALLTNAENYTFSWESSNLNFEYEHKPNEFTSNPPPEWWVELLTTGMYPKK